MATYFGLAGEPFMPQKPFVQQFPATLAKHPPPIPIPPIGKPSEGRFNKAACDEAPVHPIEKVGVFGSVSPSVLTVTAH